MGRDQKRPRYTNLSDAQLRGLRRANASGAEWYAYATLARFHGERAGFAEAGQESYCTTSAAEAARAANTDRANYSKALKSLTRKRFMRRDGTTATVLAHVADGHNGRTAIYADNLYMAALSDNVAYGSPRPIEGEAAPPKEGENEPPTEGVAGEAIPPTHDGAAGGAEGVAGDIESRRGSNPTALGVEAHPPKYEVTSTGEPLDSQTHGRGIGTEERSSTVDPLVSGEAPAPYDSYGMTYEERNRFYDDLAASYGI